MHVHADFVHYVIFVAFLFVTLAWTRLLAARYPDSVLGKALGSLVA